MLRITTHLTVAALVALGALAAATDPADAQTRYKRKAVAPAKRVIYDDNSRWYPNNADQLKFGSRIWWDQMYREGRIGGGARR